MASFFDELDAALSAAASSAFAEAAVLRPRKSSQYVERADDPDRPQTTVSGIFSAGPSEGGLKGNARGGEFAGATRMSSMTAEFWLTKAEVDRIDFLPAKGDQITLSARPGQPRYEISKVEPSDMGDLNLILITEGQTL